MKNSKKAFGIFAIVAFSAALAIGAAKGGNKQALAANEEAELDLASIYANSLEFDSREFTVISSTPANPITDNEPVYILNGEMTGCDFEIDYSNVDYIPSQIFIDVILHSCRIICPSNGTGLTFSLNTGNRDFEPDQFNIKIFADGINVLLGNTYAPIITKVPNTTISFRTISGGTIDVDNGQNNREGGIAGQYAIGYADFEPANEEEPFNVETNTYSYGVTECRLNNDYVETSGQDIPENTDVNRAIDQVVTNEIYEIYLNLKGNPLWIYSQEEYKYNGYSKGAIVNNTEVLAARLSPTAGTISVDYGFYVEDNDADPTIFTCGLQQIEILRWPGEGTEGVVKGSYNNSSYTLEVENWDCPEGFILFEEAIYYWDGSDIVEGTQSSITYNEDSCVAEISVEISREGVQSPQTLTLTEATYDESGAQPMLTGKYGTSSLYQVIYTTVGVERIHDEPSYNRGWNYDEESHSFFYFNGEEVVDLGIDRVMYNDNTHMAQIEYYDRGGSSYEDYIVPLNSAYLEQNYSEGQPAILTGSNSDIGSETYTVYINQTVTVYQKGWVNVDGGDGNYIHVYNFDDYVNYQATITKVVHTENDVFVVYYTFIGEGEETYGDTLSVVFTNSTISMTESGYLLEGSCSGCYETHQLYIPSNIQIETPTNDDPDPERRPEWIYGDGDFVYNTADYPYGDFQIFSSQDYAWYDENSQSAEIGYIAYFEESDGSFSIISRGYVDFDNASVIWENEEHTSGTISGQASCNGEYVGAIEVYCGLIEAHNEKPDRPEFEDGWTYYEEDMALVWFDNEAYQGASQIIDCKFNEDKNTATLTFQVLQLSRNGEEAYNPIGTISIKLTEAELSKMEQEEYEGREESNNGQWLISGYFDELDTYVDLIMYDVVPTIVGDPLKPTFEPVTDDPVQPETKAAIDNAVSDPEKQANIDEFIQYINEATAADIAEVAGEAKNYIDSLTDITQEEKDEMISTVDNIAEAAVVVGAYQGTAESQAEAVNNIIPEDSELDMGAVLSEFYQTQMDYLLGNKPIPDKKDTTKAPIKREPEPTPATKVDFSVSSQEYAKMIDFVETSVDDMKQAALQLRKCSGKAVKAHVGDYVTAVKVSVFRDFDEEAANNEFVENISKAIMLHMQEQVIAILESDHTPSSNQEKEQQYQDELARVKDYDSFKEIVMLVLMEKYNSLMTDDAAKYTDLEAFTPVYDLIFRAWALDDPSINPTKITLEELTTATINATTHNAKDFEVDTEMSKGEITFAIIAIGGSALLIMSAWAIPTIVAKRRNKGERK